MFNFQNEIIIMDSQSQMLELRAEKCLDSYYSKLPINHRIIRAKAKMGNLHTVDGQKP